MKQKIRRKCHECGKSKNFYLISKDKKHFYRCNKCGNIIHLTENITNRKLILTLLIILLIVGCKKAPIEEVKDYSLTFRLKPDYRVDYVLELNNSEIKRGNLEKSWNDIKVKNQVGEYTFYYWDKEHYINVLNEKNYRSNYNKTITKELKLKKKKGDIDIILSRKLEADKEQQIKLIFNGTINRLSYCIYRTIGILSAEPLKDVSVCESGFWKNNTPFGELTDKFYCDSLITRCKKKDGIECYNEKMSIPFGIKADGCYFVGKSLSDEEYKVSFNTQTMDYFDGTDHIMIYIIDMDLSQNKRILGHSWGYDFNEIVLEKELR